MITAIIVATIGWFITAMVLFFNPLVGKIYASEENHPAVKQLPKNASTMGTIALAVLIQCILWAIVYVWVKDALPASAVTRTFLFGTVLFLTKMIPRDIDRLLLTTYPRKRMFIEFAIGAVCCYIPAFSYVYFIH
ncbi:MAG: hypothetical protein HC867_07055 [Bacteroidia bacterium]|nr:hypothetical protein [Bacteroidia bacterium]